VAKLADVHREVAVITEPVVSPHDAGQFFISDDLARAHRERDEDLELRLREVDDVASQPDLPGVGIDHEFAIGKWSHGTAH